MENPNNQENKNDKIIPQGTDEIESLNDSEELDNESLEEIAGGGWGCNNKCKINYSPPPPPPTGGGGNHPYQK